MPEQSGTTALHVSFDYPWSGFAFDYDWDEPPIAFATYTEVVFRINPGSVVDPGENALQIGLDNGADWVPLARYLAEGGLVANRWTEVRVPIADLDSSERAYHRIALFNDSERADFDVFIDDVRVESPVALLTPETIRPGERVYVNGLGGDYADWSYAADVVELEAGLAGFKALGVTILDSDWGGLSLARLTEQGEEKPFVSDDYGAVSFRIQGIGPVYFGLDDGSSPVRIVPSSSWTWVRIPLHEANAAGAPFFRFNFDAPPGSVFAVRDLVLEARYGLANLSPAMPLGGTAVSFDWIAPADHSPGDEIRLRRVDGGAGEFVTTVAVGSAGAESGRATLPVPAESGEFELQYWREGSTVATATSSTFRARTPSGYGLFSPGAETLDLARVEWAAPSDHSTNDWIALYRAGSSDTDYLSRVSIDGSGVTTGVASVPTPDQDGAYEFRYFAEGVVEPLARSEIFPLRNGPEPVPEPPPPALLCTDGGLPSSVMSQAAAAVSALSTPWATSPSALSTSWATATGVFSMPLEIGPALAFCGKEGWGCCREDSALGPFYHCDQGLGCNIKTNTCEAPCGKLGQVCCDGPETNATRMCDGGPCCPSSPLLRPMCDDYCDPQSLRCVECGGLGLPPCSTGPVCHGRLAIDIGTWTCRPCGGLNEFGCDESPACNGRLAPGHESRCVPCGKLGQVACETKPRCDPGLGIVRRKGLEFCENLYAFRLEGLKSVKPRDGVRNHDADLVTFKVFINELDRGHGGGLFIPVYPGYFFPSHLVKPQARMAMSSNWTVGPFALGEGALINIEYNGTNIGDDYNINLQTETQDKIILAVANAVLVSGVTVVAGELGFAELLSALPGKIGTALGEIGGFFTDPVGTFIGYEKPVRCNGVVFADTLAFTRASIESLPFGPLEFDSSFGRASKAVLIRSHTDEQFNHPSKCGPTALTEVTISVLRVPVGNQ